ncbi:MAG: hypothetical protein KJP22_05240 [Acidimicrobiia bacterium]|nr:hypothetical protein [Acidimicrobiia bacterium]NNL13288.1 hypothetical protein [Acidimicrobiia bacterium]
MNREVDDLTEALRAVPGVADAELAADTAEGVRVRLSADADPSDVAAAVRDVLAAHGLKGKMAPPQARIEPAGPPPPPSESATILPGPGLVQTTLIPREPVEQPPDELGTFMRSPEPVARPEEPETGPAIEEDEEPLEAPSANRSLLARVRVQEDRDGVAVTIDTDDGRSITRRGRPSDAGVREAVVAAVGELSGDQPPPVLLAAEEHALGDHTMVTVLLQRHDGSFHVGSALIGAEKAFALARAAWAAMSQAQ